MPADGDSLLISSSSPPEPKRRSFASKALRVLSCASSATSDASAPAAAAVRSSAEWQGKRSRRRMHKQNSSSNCNKKERREHQAAAAAAASHDAWFAPEFDDDPFNCMNRHHPMMMVARGGRHDAERIHREIMMFQNRIVSGRMNSYDRYRDWRLDVDRMSYEELLELGDKIGYVNTGLREEQISCSLRRMKHKVYYSTEMEKKCSICQEEYEVNDEVGKLECGHSYHMCCIKQWLLQKNACPVCKTAVTAT